MHDLVRFAAAHGIRHFLFSFCDLFGVQRAKLVPAAAAADLAESGAASLMVLPWQPQVAWVATNLEVGGVALEQSPRLVLQRQLQRAAALGLQLRTGVEPEFFLLEEAADVIADGRDRQSKPCYDQQALMRHYPLIAELLDGMEQLGWGPYQADHEDANGQFEINWTFAGALLTADRHAFFRVMVATIAKRHGLRASFRPKPLADLTGNGAHLHASLWDPRGHNLFPDPQGPSGLSPLAHHFLGGLLEHAPALCALTNPIANSYERLARTTPTSGASWSPGWISYGGNNRTHMVRLPDSQRLELRLPDGAANPYLLQAAVLAAGLDGIERQLDPGPRSERNTAAEPPAGSDWRALPSSLGEALAAFAADGRLRAALGEPFCQAYLALAPRRDQEVVP